MSRPTSLQLNAAHRILLELQTLSKDEQQNCQKVLESVTSIIAREVAARNSQKQPRHA